MRVSLFFDGNNFYRAMDASFDGYELDYDKLAQWVVQQAAGTHFSGAYYYTGCTENSVLDQFLRGLELRSGFFVRREPVIERLVQCVMCGHHLSERTEKRVDTRLVAEMVQLAAVNSYDRAVVFSGDEDLVPALDAVASFGKQVMVATWGGHALATAMRVRSFGVIDLMEGCDVFTTGRLRNIEMTEKVHSPMEGEATIEDLYAQLKEAWRYFHGRNGHVSRWYFENRWKPSGPCPLPGMPRKELLELLIQQGRVDVFETVVNGRTVLALRPN